AGKAAGIVGTSPGAIGTAVAQEQLRSCVSGFLDMPTLGQPEVYLQFKDGLIDEKGDVSNDKTREFLQKWMDAYTAWVAKIVG
ncbi:MAG: NAD(P)H-dependent oxidoreductase, partial [Dokdonella sp.]